MVPRPLLVRIASARSWLLLAAFAGGCLLPSPERIAELNARDQLRVRQQAASDLGCPAEELRVDGVPNTLGRKTLWNVEGCSATARYRVIGGEVERRDVPSE